MAFEASGDIEGSITELRRLISSSVDPSGDGLAFVALADNLRILGRYDEARDIIRKAYAVLNKKDEQYPYVMYVDACIDKELGNRRPSLERLDSILERYASALENPDYEDLKNNILLIRGYDLVELNRSAEARPLLELALSKNLDRPLTLYYLGVCCFDLGDLESAKRNLKEARSLQLDPIYAARTHFYLGIIYHQQGQYAWARQELEWCLQHGLGHLRKNEVIEGLVGTSKALGLEHDARRYAEMLRQL